MGKPKVRPPSRVDSLTFPVFGLTWAGTPTSQKGDGCSVIAYCGGGGSSKTGVFNKIVVLVTADETNGGGGSTSRQIEISTGEALCFGVHAFRPYNDPLDMARLVACVGDEVLLYGIPLRKAAETESNDSGSGEGDGDNGDDSTKEEEAVLLAKTAVGKGYGANVSTYSALHQNGQLVDCIAVGCENGNVVIFHVHQVGTNPRSTQFEFQQMAECKGHTKAVCAVNFHPRGHQILSSAKDGTARIYSASGGEELGVLKCEVHDPNGPPPAQPKPGTMTTKDPRMMKRPPQILVRGCAYGDLEGKVIYTVASGKRGAAYLTKWRTLVPLNRSQHGGGPPGAGSPQGPPGAAAGGPPPASSSPGGARRTQQTLEIKQEYRVQCSPVPISATSLSSDGTILTLGSVEGSVLLYNLESSKVVKEFKEMHDLPVTCVASRPVPNMLMLPGELEGGVNFDAVSASADNRLGRWTLQRKSRVQAPKPAKSARRSSMLERYLWELLRVPLLLLLLLSVCAVRDTMEICREELGLPALVMDSGMANAGHCLYREVLWAEESRVSFVPE